MVGALASPGNAVVIWFESDSTLVADLYVSREVGSGGWSAPRLVASPSFVTVPTFFRLSETTGVVTFLNGTTFRFEWFEVRTDGFVGLPTPVPLSFSISGMAGSATRVAAVGTATLPDGGTGIYASQCR